MKKKRKLKEKESVLAASPALFSMAESNRLSSESVTLAGGTGRAERKGEVEGKKIVSVYPSKSALLRSLGPASKVKKRPWQLHPVQCLLTERRLLFAAQGTA